MNKSIRKVLMVAAAVSLSACTTFQGSRPAATPTPGIPQPQMQQSQMTQQQMQHPQMMPQQQQMMPQQQQMPYGQQGMYPQQQPYVDHSKTMQMLHSQAMKEINAVRERLTRVERAMIRLDRRMQLVERNEINRMQGTGGGDWQMEETEMEPMSFNSKPRNKPQSIGTPLAARTAPEKALGASTAPFARTHQAGVRPVAYMPFQASTRNQAQAVTSSLQAAPSAGSAQQARGARSYALPSIADAPRESGTKADKGSLAIWTINYAGSKVWPERGELAGSRDVVEALRDSKSVAVFARGNNPTSKEFRERVRAVSKYLTRVSEKDSVAISAMPADHLNEDTIEIFVSR
mgnify:CR=1 FL=1